MFRDLVVAALFLIAAAAFAETAEQTDWAGGDGVEGPVTDWEDTFDSATDINWSSIPGELSLGIQAQETLITQALMQPICVIAADIDGDNDVDVVSCTEDYGLVCWYENMDGSGGSWSSHQVVWSGARYLDPADVDDDGDTDIFYATSGSVGWRANDGDGLTWTNHSVGSASDATSICSADIDGDDDIDLVATMASSGAVTWWSNDDGSGGNWTSHTVATGFTSAESVCVTDVDGDSDLDVIAGGGRSIAWWSNDDGAGTSWTKRTVFSFFSGSGISSVCAADIDGDTDIDVVATDFTRDRIAWFSNDDGVGGAWTIKILQDGLGGAESVKAADMDGDSDMDIVSAAIGADEVAWWENVDGTGSTFTKHVLNSNFNGACFVYVEDLNGDDTNDVICCAGDAGESRWWDLFAQMSSGELISSILDTEDLPWWGVITWTADVPDDSELNVEVRASDDPGDMGSWTEVADSGDDLSDYIADDLPYFQYRLIMEASSDNDLSPTFEDITIEWADHSGVEDVDMFTASDDGGVLVSWAITGDTPVSLRVLRSVGDGEPVAIHDNPLPGSATCYLDILDKGFQPLVQPLAAGVEYRYWLEVTEADGTVSLFGPSEAVRIEPERLVLALSAPYPSPAHDVVTISYTLPNNCSVELAVYDLSGRRVATLVDTEQTAGRHEVSWSCSDVPSGVYLYNLVTDKGSLTKRLVVGR